MLVSSIHFYTFLNILYDTVDGSEIPRPTTWDGAKTLKVMGYLPYQLVSLPDFWLNHQQYFAEV